LARSSPLTTSTRCGTLAAPTDKESVVEEPEDRDQDEDEEEGHMGEG